ncbi:hypothetical protein ACEZCY_32755 [Streptacidiphilus sp. N1-12]|uniref:Uncharacterized protein n=2 Tax=Streptacidiphilus alkalitolerans TaxID=3342712 RepID=A0ABV6WPP7_9ACTN
MGRAGDDVEDRADAVGEQVVAQQQDALGTVERGQRVRLAVQFADQELDGNGAQALRASFGTESGGQVGRAVGPFGGGVEQGDPAGGADADAGQAVGVQVQEAQRELAAAGEALQIEAVGCDGQRTAALAVISRSRWSKRMPW